MVVPVYKAAETLAALVDELGRVLPGLCAEFEVILVCDGSPDRSWAIIKDLCQTRAWLHGMLLMRNFGQHNALLCGIRRARFPVIITMDDDLQHPPTEIVHLLNALEDGVDVVYGTPQEEQHGFWRDLASQATKLALRDAMGAEIARQVSAFRVFRTTLREAFASYQNPFVSIDVLLTWGTTRFRAVPVIHASRLKGLSNYTFRKLMTHALNMMTGFSVLPLQLASVIGFVFTLFGLGVLVYVVGRFLLRGGSVPGFPFLASIIAIFSGAQLFALGIIGEYLARMHFRMMDRPSYAVRECTPGGEHGRV